MGYKNCSFGLMNILFIIAIISCNSQTKTVEKVENKIISGKNEPKSITIIKGVESYVDNDGRFGGSYFKKVTIQVYDIANMDDYILTENNTNIYVNQQAINFYNDTIDEINQVLDSDFLETTNIENNKEPNRILRTYNGVLQIWYENQSRKLKEIKIITPDITVFNGAKVGDSREQIENKIANGFYWAINREIDYKEYYFVKIDNKHGSGTGYTITFEGNKASSITVGVVAFSP